MTWEQSLARSLQSWRDTALANSRDWRFIESCSYCATNSYLAVIAQTIPWPHWMLHTLRERLQQLRADTFMSLLNASPGRFPHDPEFTAAVVDYMVTYDLWLADRMRSMVRWERSVFKRFAA